MNCLKPASRPDTSGCASDTRSIACRIILILQQYDTARRLMRSVVELPNRHADLFVRLCLQNNGVLSKSKRQLPENAKLSSEEIAGLEAAVSEAFALNSG